MPQKEGGLQLAGGTHSIALSVRFGRRLISAPNAWARGGTTEVLPTFNQESGKGHGEPNLTICRLKPHTIIHRSGLGTIDISPLPLRLSLDFVAFHIGCARPSGTHPAARPRVGRTGTLGGPESCIRWRRYRCRSGSPAAWVSCSCVRIRILY